MSLSALRLSLCATLLTVQAAPVLAFDPAWLGAADCRIAPVKDKSAGEVSWTGGCVDGYASGQGVLKMPDFTYEGTLKKGVPHGDGFLQREGWGWYEGDFVDGLPHGKGTHLKVDRSRYTGEWVQGARHGQGEASFGTGGSYKGEWKGNAFDGQGAIVYAGAGHKYQGRFEDGRVAGLPKPEFAQGEYALKGNYRGTDMREDRVRSNVPLKARWHELTAAQQNTFRNHYPALEGGDEPPFPAQGQGPLLDKLSGIHESLGGMRGSVSMHVLVGKDGTPLGVTAYGAPSATIVRALSQFLMREQFKPALCRGQPCEMVYPANINFSISAD